MNATTRRAYLSGDTFMVREILKERGWKWDATRKLWWRDCDSDDTPEWIVSCVRSYPGVRNRGQFSSTIE